MKAGEEIVQSLIRGIQSKPTRQTRQLSLDPLPSLSIYLSPTSPSLHPALQSSRRRPRSRSSPPTDPNPKAPFSCAWPAAAAPPPSPPPTNRRSHPHHASITITIVHRRPQHIIQRTASASLRPRRKARPVPIPDVDDRPLPPRGRVGAGAGAWALLTGVILPIRMLMPFLCLCLFCRPIPPPPQQPSVQRLVVPFVPRARRRALDACAAEHGVAAGVSGLLWARLRCADVVDVLIVWGQGRLGGGGVVRGQGDAAVVFS
ncbi:hypothetical protein BC567DRAFT_67831 [Phyllosticta citribraziliensis]